jgi:hypothetical protein
MMELLMTPLAGTLRRLVPQSAMLSAVSGVALTAITMGFAFQV